MKNPVAILIAAKHALLSYASGNAAPDLARSIAGQIEDALGAIPKDFGLPIEQEPKYSTDPITGLLVNRASGVLIPRDEPIMLFRAQDIHARAVVRRYCDLVTNTEGAAQTPHQRTCSDRSAAFITFADQHPERLKTPDTTPCAN